MAELCFLERKGAVLTRPSLPCLAPYHTINLTAGCPFSCRYCYAQSFRNYPGKGKVIFHANTLQALAEQLPRKRKPPAMVFFSSACDPFMPFPETLDCLYGCIHLLLKAGSRVLISTKGNIPTRFIELFARYSQQVYVEMGFACADDEIRQLLEPYAASIADRMQTLQALGEAGIFREIRMIPLIPELSDDEYRFKQTMRAEASCGVTNGSMSYLYLRPGNLDSMTCHFGDWRFIDVERRIFTMQLESPDGRSMITLPASAYRANKYKVLAEIGSRYGIHLRLFSCKNPDIANECCHPLSDFLTCDIRQTKEQTGNLFALLDHDGTLPTTKNFKTG